MTLVNIVQSGYMNDCHRHRGRGLSFCTVGEILLNKPQLAVLRPQENRPFVRRRPPLTFSCPSTPTIITPSSLSRGHGASPTQVPHSRTRGSVPPGVAFYGHKSVDTLREFPAQCCASGRREAPRTRLPVRYFADTKHLSLPAMPSYQTAT